ncbi:hypothetical protein BST61_g8446 [Cercospora zeina]
MPPKPTKAQLAAAGLGGNTTAADRRRRQERQANLAALSALGGASSQAGKKSLPSQQQQEAEEAGPSSLPLSRPAPITPASAPESPPADPDPAPLAFAYPSRPQAQLLREMRPEGEIAERLRLANVEIGELQEAIADYYDKLAEKDHQIEELGRGNDDLTRRNAELNRLNSTLASNNKDAAEAASRSEAELVKEKDAHAKTAAELADSKQKVGDLRQFTANLKKDLETVREEKDTIRAQRDVLETDNKLAHRDIDTLQKQIAENDDAGTARAFLEVIHEEVEEQFAQEGKDLTPDNFAAHFRRVSQQAAINRGPSADSSNSQPQDDADSKRRSTDRVTSMAQELDAAQQQFDSDDESNAAVGTDDLHIPKRRPFSTSDDISTSAYAITELKQKIQDQAREMEKMRARNAQLEEQAKEAEQTRTQIAKLEGDHEEDFDRIEKQEEKLEKAEADKIQPWQMSPTFEWFEMDSSKPTTSDADTQTVDPEPATTTTETTTVVCGPTQVVRYTEKVRDATLFEAFNRSPFWLQILIAIAILLLLTFGFRGWYQEKMWLAANGPALHQVRYQQAQRAIMGNFRSVLENLVGYDSRLLG